MSSQMVFLWYLMLIITNPKPFSAAVSVTITVGVVSLTGIVPMGGDVFVKGMFTLKLIHSDIPILHEINTLGGWGGVGGGGGEFESKFNHERAGTE